MDPKDIVIPASRDELLDLQWRRLQDQLDYVFAHSAFYQRKFGAVGATRGDIRTIEDFRQLPVTTKDELRIDQEEFAPYGSTVCVPRERIAWLPSTSGSSGRPVILPRTARDTHAWTTLTARMCRMNGVNPGDIYQVIMAFQWIFTGIAFSYGLEKAGAIFINAGMGNTERQIWTLQNLEPRVVFATPSYFMHLAAELERRGIADTLKVEVAVSGGEIGANLPEWKSLLKRRIPSIKTVCDVGGVTEVGTPIWSDCMHESGAHVFEDAVFMEILDVQTRQPALEGEVLYTDLISESAPLIRYEVRDIVSFTDEPCECGLPFGRFPRGVLGRSDDMITVNSANVFPSAIESCVRDTAGLSGEYQLLVQRRDELDVLTIRAERADGAPVADSDIAHALQARLQVATPVHPRLELLDYGQLPRFVYKSKRVADERNSQSLDDLARLAKSQQNM